MNVQTIFGKLQSRSKTSSVFCGIYAGAMWVIVVLSAIAMGMAGSLGGTFLGRLDGFDSGSVVAGYEILGNLFLSALMGFAMIAIFAGVFLISIPAVLYTIASVGGFSKSKKEMMAVQTPGGIVDFRLFKKDAIYKLVISGVTIVIGLWSELRGIVRVLRTTFERSPIDAFRYRGNVSFKGMGVSLLILSPAIVVFVLAAMNLSDIGRWQRWLNGVRAQNSQQQNGAQDV